MRRIATSTSSGSITSAIKRLLSARHCSAAASSWRRLFLANASLGNAESVKSAKSADTVTCAAANPNSAARASNKEQRCSLASAFSPNVVPCFATFWQWRSLARVISADTAARSADSRWLHSTADTTAALDAHPVNIAAHDAANSANIFSTTKSIAGLIAAAVIATARSTAAWQVCSLGNAGSGNTNFAGTVARAAVKEHRRASASAVTPTLCHVPPLPNNDAHQWESSPPTLQRNSLTTLFRGGHWLRQHRRAFGRLSTTVRLGVVGQRFLSCSRCLSLQLCCKCRTRAAFLLILQAGKSGLTLLLLCSCPG
jgi:hypothetical protein